MTWPHDADGDVFRSLEADNFDFTKECDIDFNIDFEDWPPPLEAIRLLQSKYSFVETVKPTRDDKGFIEVRIRSKLNYCFVIDTQKNISNLMIKYKGRCESWGVLCD